MRSGDKASPGLISQGSAKELIYFVPHIDKVRLLLKGKGNMDESRRRSYKFNIMKRGYALSVIVKTELSHSNQT
jgi:hypothetical protein